MRSVICGTLISMIVFSSVTKEFLGRKVLGSVSFRVNPGEFVCLTGPSGAGKSTIVHLLVRAIVPTTGKIEVDGVDLRSLPLPVLQLYRRRVGVVFQDYKLLSDRTVAENVAFPLEVCGEEDSVIKVRVVALLQRLQLSAVARAFPRQLSGGEKARTALARALVHQPKMLIADEPTGNIDPEQSLHIMNVLKEANAAGMTVVLASHDQPIVDALQVRVLRLESGLLVRDGVGGYAQQNVGVTDSIHRVRKHEIFDQKSDQVQVKEVPAKSESPKKQRGTGPSHTGHIKPIAI